jgi:hypothetical protein
VDIRYLVDRVRADLARVPPVALAVSPKESPTTGGLVAVLLAGAEAELAAFDKQPWWRRWWRAARVRDGVRDRLFTAQEDLMLLLPVEDLSARVPQLRAALKALLTADDPRYDAFTRLLDAAELDGAELGNRGRRQPS